MFKKVFSLSALSVVHYVVSFLKQIIISKYIGVNPEYDVYLYVLSIINLLQFFSGPIAEASTPQFHDSVSLNLDEASKYFSKITNNVILISIVSILLVYGLLILKPDLIVANNYSTEQLQDYLLILLPLIFANSFSHIYGLYLNSLNRFIFQTIIKNISGIMSFLLLYYFIQNYEVKAVAYTFLFATVTTLAFQIYDVFRSGIRYKPLSGFKMNSKYYKIIGSLSFTYVLYSFVTIYDRNTYMFFSAGLLSAFGYAYSVYMIPNNLVVNNIANVAWTRILEIKKEIGIEHAINKVNVYTFVGIIFICYLCSFVTIFSKEIAIFLFMRGKTSLEDAILIGDILKFLIWGVPFLFYSSISGKVITSLQRSKDLAFSGLILTFSQLIIIFLAKFFMEKRLLYLGLPLGLFAQSVFLFFRLNKLNQYSLDEIKGKSKILSVSVVLFLSVIVQYYIRPILNINNKFILILELSLSFIIPILLISLIYLKEIKIILKEKVN